MIINYDLDKGNVNSKSETIEFLTFCSNNCANNSGILCLLISSSEAHYERHNVQWASKAETLEDGSIPHVDVVVGVVVVGSAAEIVAAAEVAAALVVGDNRHEEQGDNHEMGTKLEQLGKFQIVEMDSDEFQEMSSQGTDADDEKLLSSH